MRPSNDCDETTEGQCYVSCFRVWLIRDEENAFTAQYWKRFRRKSPMV